MHLKQFCSFCALNTRGAQNSRPLCSLRKVLQQVLCTETDLARSKEKKQSVAKMVQSSVAAGRVAAAAVLALVAVAVLDVAALDVAALDVAAAGCAHAHTYH